MLTKQDAKMAQGLAIVAMVMLHLFCRKDNFLYDVYFLIRDVPLIYYLGLFGDMCVPIYCFCSGYAQLVLMNTEKNKYYINTVRRALKFLVHFWFVVVLFVFIGLIMNNPEMPGSFRKFLENFLLYRFSYNGAWWFVVTYLLLLLFSPIIKYIIEKLPPIVIICGSGIIYLLAHIYRYKYIFEFEYGIINWAWQQLVLFGTSQFSFIVGMLFVKYDVLVHINRRLKDNVYRKVLLNLIPVFMFVIHCIEESVIIAPLTGIITLSCFHLRKKQRWEKRFFLFLGKHSTNIWLTHMFFYMTLFDNFVFIVKKPVCILGLMLVICIFVSYGINAFECGIERIMSKRNYVLKNK